jgi:hypothetical protein
MKRTPVKSSNIAAVGYDSTSKTLEVEFKTGDIYTYSNVPPATVIAFRKSKSQGNYFASWIKKQYKGVKSEAD